MTNKQRYRNFCTNNPEVPLFLQPFWLDAVAEKWDVVLLLEGEKVNAILPFCFKGKLITKRIYLPDVSFYQSIIFKKNFNNAQKQKAAEVLFGQLPKVVKYYFKFLPIYSALDLSKQGFQKELYNTYVISTQQDFQLSKHHQRYVSKGLKAAYKIEESKNIHASYQLISETFLRQKIKPKLSFDDLTLLNALCKKHACGQVLDCINQHNELLATLFIAEDNAAVYYLFGGYNSIFKNSGAMTFLLHHAILYALQQKKEFNFCGSSKKSIAIYFEGFGAKPVTLAIWKKSLLRNHAFMK